jgi:hypothetical protein
MFERFSEGARIAVVRAREESRMRGDSYLGTEHLLLGTIADPGGPGARLLGSCGIAEDQVRAALSKPIDRGNRPEAGALRFTGSATRALQLAVQEADALQHGAVDTDHLLIALAETTAPGGVEEEPTSARLLRDLGVDAEALRAGCEATPRREPPQVSVPAVDPARRVTDQIERMRNARLRTDQLLGALSAALDLAEEEAIYFGRSAADGGDLLIGLTPFTGGRRPCRGSRPSARDPSRGCRRSHHGCRRA